MLALIVSGFVFYLLTTSYGMASKSVSVLLITFVVFTLILSLSAISKNIERNQTNDWKIIKWARAFRGELFVINPIFAFVLIVSYWVIPIELEHYFEIALVTSLAILWILGVLLPKVDTAQSYKEIHWVKNKKQTIIRYYGNENTSVVAERLMNSDKVILFVPHKEQRTVEMMGAVYSNKLKKYYIPAIWDITPFTPWIVPESFSIDKKDYE